MAINKILIVDDSPSERLYLTDILVKNGFAVSTAVNGDEAIERIRAERPDLILMDVVMPKLDGFGACKALREREETREIPIILITTRGEAKNVEEGFVSGCTDYVTKPVNGLELITKLTSYLGARS